jgi:predicted AAA+ superfamily ATPase
MRRPKKKATTARRTPASGSPPSPLTAGFSLLKGVLEDEAGRAWEELSRTEWRDIPAYQRLWESVLERQEFSDYPRVGTGLQDHWLERLLDDPNPFHRKAELAPFDAITPSLVREYVDELKAFLGVLRTDFEPIVAKLNAKSGLPTPTFKDMRGLPPRSPLPAWMAERRRLKERLLASPGTLALAREVADHFLRNGFGKFGKARAFRWDAVQGRLEGVEAQDPIRLEDLVGYDEQRRPLLDNIEGFVSGGPGNNVLIYGERGTGKSSTVKALLNAYQDRGLRLLEVSPGDPGNVLLIATSNRRHLVREFFSEREEGERQDGEVRGQDTVQQKLSLADRFGLVVSFYSPDQDTYLKMVESWARTEGVRASTKDLRAKALLWARQNNGPSGRTARQFVNDLKGRG